MGIREMIERVRAELYELIERHGTSDKRTINKSQQLDGLLNEYGRIKVKVVS